MALVKANVALDFSKIDLNFFVRASAGSFFSKNQPQTFDGITYKDSHVTAAEDPLTQIASVLVISGNNLTVKAGSIPSTGTSTLLMQISAGAAVNWSLSGISQTFISIYNAMKTASAADDTTFLSKALSGNDQIQLSAFADIVSGYAGNDTIWGYGGTDQLTGAGGNDKLFGGDGIDTLRGGAGTDRFGYQLVTDGGDKIADFASGDLFTFTSAQFHNLAAGTLNAKYFRTVANLAALPAVQQADDYFVYDRGADNLYYDADGKGSGAMVLIADLQTNINLAATDILIV